MPGPSLGIPDDHAPSKNDAPLTSQAATPGPTETGKREDLTPPAARDAAPLRDVAREPKTDRPADKPAGPAAGGDVFGALQDPPPEKREVKEPERGPKLAGDSPADAAPPKRRRRRKPAQPDVATLDPLRTAEQSAGSEPVAQTKQPEAVKAEDATKTIEMSKTPPPETKRVDEWSTPAASGKAPPLQDLAGETKTDRPADKPPSPSAGNDAFGGLKDTPAEKQELKGPGASVNGVGESPPDAAPHKHRRKKKPPQPESATPGPVRTAERSPTSEPAADKKPEETVKPEIAEKITEAPKPIVLDTPKSEPKASEPKPSEPKPSEPKPSEPKLGEPPTVGGPSLDASASPTKTEPRPEIVAATPTNVPLANVPANLAPRPAADEESQQATVSFARRMPEKTDAGNSLTYRIVVRNNGSKPVKLVEVDEAVPSDHVVQTTDPLAETHDQTLHWSLRDLGPHEERTIAITLAAPAPPQPIVRTAAIPKSDRVEEEHERTAKPDEPDNLPHMQLELIAPAMLRTANRAESASGPPTSARRRRV